MTDLTTLPHAAALLAALDRSHCDHCSAPLDRRNEHSDGMAATCYDCRRDTPFDDALVLTALADLLEEAGDPRAAGLRLIGNRRPDGVTSPWHWSLDQLGDGRWPHQLPAALLARVGDGRAYPSRAAALLALAEMLALAEALAE